MGVLLAFDENGDVFRLESVKIRMVVFIKRRENAREEEEEKEEEAEEEEEDLGKGTVGD